MIWGFSYHGLQSNFGRYSREGRATACSSLPCRLPGLGAPPPRAGRGGPAPISAGPAPAHAGPAPERPTPRVGRAPADAADSIRPGGCGPCGRRRHGLSPALAGLLGRVPTRAWRAARSPLLCYSLRKTSSSQGRKSDPIKQSLKKPKLPEGRFDAPEDAHLEKEPLTKFPDDVNPVTKEKGGPRGPEPTRYGDWERKGRCIDF